jgi:putative transposase
VSAQGQRTSRDGVLIQYNSDSHHRRSIRLQGFDYTQVGAYFVTICVQDKCLLFGEMNGEEVDMNDAGRMVDSWWTRLTSKFTAVELDEYVIMPNHFHGIIAIVGADLCVCPEPNEDAHGGAPLRQINDAPISRIIQWFKSITTHEYANGVRDQGWPPFRGRLWQRNYYEHVIRNEDELNRARKYIIENPMKWAADPEHS